MGRTSRSFQCFGLGLLALFVFVLGAEPFEVPGQNLVMERVGGSLAVAGYCAVCQFLFARRDARTGASNWRNVAAMVLGLAAASLFIIAAEGGQQWRYSAVPLLLAGCVGTVVGMAIGRRIGKAGVA
jgi:hypothetical protein